MKRTQTGWVMIISFVVISALFLWKVEPVVANLVAAILLLIALPNLYCLSIKVDDEYVRFSFGIGLIRGKFALSSISSCIAKKYIPYGWGIRFRPGILIFNVSGNSVIELHFKDKKRKVWLGTHVPEELASYIQAKIDKESN